MKSCCTGGVTVSFFEWVSFQLLSEIAFLVIDVVSPTKLNRFSVPNVQCRLQVQNLQNLK